MRNTGDDWPWRKNADVREVAINQCFPCYITKPVTIGPRLWVVLLSEEVTFIVSEMFRSNWKKNHYTIRKNINKITKIVEYKTIRKNIPCKPRNNCKMLVGKYFHNEQPLIVRERIGFSILLPSRLMFSHFHPVIHGFQFSKNHWNQTFFRKE